MITLRVMIRIRTMMMMIYDYDDDGDKNVGTRLTGEGGNKYKLGNAGCKCSIGTMEIKSHYHQGIEICAQLKYIRNTEKNTLEIQK